MATKNIVPNANGEGSIGTAAKGWGGAFLTSTATSSTSAGAKLQLISNDGAVMADTHQLGIIEFLGAEDTSGTISLGASIEAVADETFTASENASALVFKTTSGTTVSEVLRLDKDKLATFAGNIKIPDNGTIGSASAASALTIADNGLLTMTVGASSNPRISFAGASVSGTHFIQLDRGSGASTSSFEVYLNGATKFEVKADGNVEIADGSLVIANAGDGINFSATSDASGSSSEVLDDYEEGSWTPTLSTSVGSVGTASSAGQYTKIGRQVIVHFQFTLSSSSGGSGTLKITNLPFTVDANSGAVTGSGRILDTANTISVGHFTSTHQISIHLYNGNYAGTDFFTTGFVTYFVA